MVAAPPGGGGEDRLQVAADGRFLGHADGRPFFYLGDTAWELFHRLHREEVDHYRCRRAAQGFTLIQAEAVGEFAAEGQREVLAPTPGENLDWVLALDDAARSFPPSGTVP